MKERWNFDNPRETFQSYEEELKLFDLKKNRSEKLDAQIESLTKKLDKTQKEADHLEAGSSKSAKSYKDELESKNLKEAERANKLLSSEARAYETERAELLKEQNTEHEKIHIYYQERMDRLNKSESLSPDQLSPKAQTALEIEKEKYAFYEEAASRLRAEETGCLEYLNAAETEIASMEAEISAMISEYEPKIDGARLSIEDKKAEKEAELLKLYQALAEEEAIWDKELLALELEKERLGLLEAKSDERIEALSSCEVRLDAAEKTAKERVGAKKSELQTGLAEAEAAIGHLKSELGGLISERDDKIKLLEQRMEEIRKVQKEKEAKLQEKIREEKKLEEDKEEELEKKILHYARSQGIDHSDNYDLLLGHFKSLQARTGIWKGLVSEIDLKNREQVYELELVRQRQILDKLSYENLEGEMKKAESFRDKLGPVSKKPQPFIIFAVFIAVFGLVVFGLSFLKGIQYPKAQMGGGIVLMLAGLAFLFYALRKPGKDLRKLCRFISLSEDNESFSAIEKQAISDTETQEVGSIKEMGELIRLKNLGSDGLNSEKAKREAYQAGYYEAGMKVLERKYENKRAEIERGRRLAFGQNELKLFLDETKMDLAAMSHFKDLSYAKRQLLAYDELLTGLNSEKASIASEMEGFESNYAEFLRFLDDKNWTMPKMEGRDELESEIYLINDGTEGDKRAHINIHKLDIHQAPILLTYDKYLLNHEAKLMAGDLSSLIMDLLKAFYRLNGSKNIAQYIYGEVEGLRSAVNREAEGFYKLRKVMEGPEELETLAGEAEADDTVLYYVFKPRDAEGKIEEGLLESLSSVTAKTLLPVYICYKGALEDSRVTEGTDYTQYLSEAGAVLNYSNANYTVEKR